ncbi:sigma-54-dependent Fis family transcriptional regulator [Magnetovirga frankeli]|uniref:sigma 54-interacting transcriptional regulator n=1 Tax=Magnetovirga frankeli TaxID=947516 RepID=UPI0012938255|nr:sigma-54-dependent Fis family transcriptional regulator [gamma proteobacterium SS-5]
MNKQPHKQPPETELVGNSAEFQRVLQAARMVAATEASVLLRGPDGSGRCRLAGEIHRLSTRRKQDLFSFNCAILDDLQPLLEGDGGSIFLGDVDQLPQPLQAGLLAWLETGQLAGRPLDARLIASASEQMLQRVEQGLFRQDLYHRLNVVPLEVPRLSERNGDIPLLLKAFVREFARQHGRRAPQFGVGAMNLLKAYTWPGNVRELRNFAERMVILLPGQLIQPEGLPTEMKSQPGAARGGLFQLPEGGIDLNQLEADILRQALLQAGGNRSKAARLLKISRDTFLYRLQKFAVDV